MRFRISQKVIARIFFLLVLSVPALTLVVITRFPQLYAQTINNDEVNALKKDIDSLSSQIESLDKEIEKFSSQIKNTQSDQKTLKSAIKELENRRILLLKEIDRTNLKIKQTNTSLTATEDRITQTTATLNLNVGAMNEVLRNINMSDESRLPMLGVLSTKKTMSDALFEIKNLEQAGDAMHERVTLLKDSKKRLEDAKIEYDNHKKSLVELSSTLKDKRYLVDASKVEKDKILKETQNKEALYKQLLEDRRKIKNELEKEMLEIENKLQVAIDASQIPTSGKGILKYPVSKPRITQYFGNTEFSTKNPQVYSGRGHNGLDFGVSVGTPILSALKGVVVATGNTDDACPGASYGKWVLIRHANGLTTLYAHLSRIDVFSNQSVETGEKIGLSGNTGYSTGPHLHFTVYSTQAVRVSGPTEYKSKACGTYMVIPLSPPAGYLNPLSYL